MAQAGAPSWFDAQGIGVAVVDCAVGRAGGVVVEPQLVGRVGMVAPAVAVGTVVVVVKLMSRHVVVTPIWQVVRMVGGWAVGRRGRQVVLGVVYGVGRGMRP